MTARHHAGVIEELAKMQQGGASEGQAIAIGKSLRPQETSRCSAICQGDFATCVAKSGASKMEDVRREVLRSCMDDHGTCSQDCPVWK